MIYKKVIKLIKRKKQYNDYKEQFKHFTNLSTHVNQRFSLRWEDRYPCLNDATPTTNFDRHYIYHTAWAARIIKKTNPDLHIDISSILDFAAILSAFIPVRYYDYRPAKIQLDNLTSEHADLLALPFDDNSLESLSCMHTVEHVGLGRYGDPLDYDGDLKAINELKRVLAVSGDILFVVPIGKPRIMFNAHRIYAYEQVMDYFKELSLRQFAVVPDNPEDGGIIVNATQKMADRQNYGCGCFWFRKLEK